MKEKGEPTDRQDPKKLINEKDAKKRSYNENRT